MNDCFNVYRINPLSEQSYVIFKLDEVIGPYYARIGMV